MTEGSARLGVDVGGTFTDVVLVVEGRVTTAKVPTTPADGSEGVLRGVERACESAGVDPEVIGQFRHATTVATNALLEGEGASAALVTTDGFTDVLAIGRQDRPALYDLTADATAPLVPAERRFGVDERATPEGIERTVDESAVRDLVDDLSGVDSVAVSFLHAYAHPENEARVASILRDELDVPVAASHEVLPTFREYERTATTVADATVTPIVDDYLGRLVERAAAIGLPDPRVMQSNGGIADAGPVREHAVTTALSGPAAGVVGAALFEPEGGEGVVSFDMGGTSCDVGLVRDGEVERTTDGDVGDHPVRVPMVDVHTVGAGGGSIAWVDAGGALRVGPRSAGADPGPACYGRGADEPTVTDAAVILGYIGADAELGGTISIDAGAARTALADLAAEAGLADARTAARGVYRVANATMTRAIRTVTVERGHDTRDFGIVAFGGAGPMHAAAIADRLGVETVLVPKANGVLSALGLLAADERRDAVRTHRGRLDALDATDVEDVYDDLAATARDGLADPAAATVSRVADCRYAGQRFELAVEVPAEFDPATVSERFHAVHERIRGYRLPEEPVELVTLRVRASVSSESPTLRHEGSTVEPTARRDAVFGDAPRATAIYDRGSLPVGATVSGPAILEGAESTVVVPPGWTAGIDGAGTARLEVAT